MDRTHVVVVSGPESYPYFDIFVVSRAVMSNSNKVRYLCGDLILTSILF